MFICAKVSGISHQHLGRLANRRRGTCASVVRLSGDVKNLPKGTIVIAQILGALAGEKIAGRNSKLTGALVGAAIPAIARRGLGPLGLVLAAGYGAKKLIDYRRAKRSAPVN